MNVSDKTVLTRQAEFDVARGFAVIFMVLIHTMLYFWNWNDHICGDILLFLGAFPTAPVFIFLIGCGVVYTSHGQPSQLRNRGCLILALAFIVNILVHMIPYCIAAIETGTTDYWQANWTQIYSADILHFAAMALMFFAITRYLKWKPNMVLIVAIALSLIGNLLARFIPQIESPVLQALTGLIWKSYEGSKFPFTSWIVIAAAGYWFAQKTIDCEAKGKIYRKVSLISIPVCMISACILIRLHGWDMFSYTNWYHQQSLLMSIMFASFVLSWLGICYFLSRHIPALLMNIARKLSMNVTAIYVLQYIFIMYLKILVCNDSVYPILLALSLFLIFIISTYYLADGYRMIMKPKEFPLQ